MEDWTARQPMLFVIEEDAAEQENLRQALADANMTVLALDGIGAATRLADAGAACDLLIVAATAVEGREDEFDRLLTAAGDKSKVIVYGLDPHGEAALHCLNRGACDFLPKPLDHNTLFAAVDTALGDEFHADPDSRGIVAQRPVLGWIELTASSRLEQLRRLERFSEMLFNSSLPEKVREDLQLAVEEVGRNAVEWGNRFDPDKQVHVSYIRFEDRIVIKVEDEGEGFSPEAVPDPTADPVKSLKERAELGKRPGGYGVYLIQKLVDEVVYSEKGNTVLMIKYLPAPEPAAAAEDTRT
ncbi:MAG: ATP-binding protein [Planctomycetota bacterium]|jgi:anti-sigma regulatory factor (Ser/Thr protein kinase)/FixJ family two-component response regulator|nr:ATP-binding protein [Planctomycetota bacterium]